MVLGLISFRFKTVMSISMLTRGFNDGQSQASSLDSPRNGLHGARYWNIITDDTFNLFPSLFLSQLTGKFTGVPGSVIKFCGNPECYF
jgi:hypothetical protein